MFKLKKDTQPGAFLFRMSLHYIENLLSNKVVQS